MFYEKQSDLFYSHITDSTEQARVANLGITETKSQIKKLTPNYTLSEQSVHPAQLTETNRGAMTVNNEGSDHRSFMHAKSMWQMNQTATLSNQRKGENLKQLNNQSVLSSKQFKSSWHREQAGSVTGGQNSFQGESAFQIKQNEVCQSDQEQVGGYLGVETLIEVKVFTISSLKETWKRIKQLNDNQEPHIKLFIMDMINFYLNLLSLNDRSELIQDLHELQIILNLGDDASENAKQKMQSFISKKQNFESKTLQQINTQMNSHRQRLQVKLNSEYMSDVNDFEELPNHNNHSEAESVAQLSLEEQMRNTQSVIQQKQTVIPQTPLVTEIAELREQIQNITIENQQSGEIRNLQTNQNQPRNFEILPTKNKYKQLAEAEILGVVTNQISRNTTAKQQLRVRREIKKQVESEDEEQAEEQNKVAAVRKSRTKQVIQSDLSSNSIVNGTFDFNLLEQGINCKTYDIHDMNQCEFLTQCGNFVAVKSSDQTIDLLDSNTFDVLSILQCEQAKCISIFGDFIFVGGWTGTIKIYDIKRDYQVVQLFQTNAAIRSICQINDSTLFLGQNDGWIDLLHIDKDVNKMELVFSEKYPKLGHIFQAQVTSNSDTLVLCTYTGVHFCNINIKKTTISLEEQSYQTQHFVNKVLEYAPGKFLAALWDFHQFIFIDHGQKKIICELNHPNPSFYRVRCWGLAKVIDFDEQRCPFVLARDNTGFVIIDVKNVKAYCFSTCQISANLFGHGDVLKVSKSASGFSTRILTVLQSSNMKGILTSLELPQNLTQVFMTLAKA